MKILAYITTAVTIFLCYYTKTSLALDAIIPNQNLYDKNADTLVSSGEAFELGFFSPRNSSNRYVGVWFKKTVTEKTVVWVANRDKPIRDSSGILKITPNGSVVILRNQSTSLVWSSHSLTVPRNPILQLLDTGNLVVKDGNDDSYIWQSFDHPCDTMISGMKLGLNLKTGQRWIFSSWKNLEDPSTGDYSYEVDVKGLPVLSIVKGAKVTKYRTGPWDGVHFGDSPALGPSQVMNSSFVFNSTDVVYSFEDNRPVISRLQLNESGYVSHYIWRKDQKKWQNIFNLVHDQCDTYGKCSSNEICNPSLQDACQCLPGYRPRNQNHRDTQEQGKGCERKPQLNCSEAVGFKMLARTKLPDNSHLLSNNILMDLEKCRDGCLKNCSCVAYASNMASACIVWLGDLLDTKQYNTSGQDLYIKVAASELESKHPEKRTAIIIIGSVVMGILLLALFGCFIHRKRASKRNPDLRAHRVKSDSLHNYGEEDLDLPIYDMETIANATDNFSSTNTIGEGGFGCVYKGMLPTGEEIAVKRLSKDSLQGLKEFKNEVVSISKLQHRNLVRLLGCCIYREERMLIYEYMPNRSLDFYIFDPNKDNSLDWKMRFEIILGIARGLLYLHRDSILRIVHRDLKANNILLDGHMNPKISDFGLARIFGGDQTEANTMRIMGTYGYMSPEYVVDGVFSTKSDVFSFGVLVLEIVSGKKNRGFFHPDHDLNLLGHAWNFWKEDRHVELVDHLLGEAVSVSEVLRCIQVGLLCVQQRPEDRPTMSSVLLMLDSENTSLPQPKQPGFYNERFLADRDSSSTGATSCTLNEATMTMPQGR